MNAIMMIAHGMFHQSPHYDRYTVCPHCGGTNIHQVNEKRYCAGCLKEVEATQCMICLKGENWDENPQAKR